MPFAGDTGGDTQVEDEKMCRLFRSTFLAIAVGASAFTSAGNAQQAGTYEGQTDDGHPVSITVEVDPNNGSLEVTSADWGFICLTTKSIETLEGNIGFGLNDGYDIIDGKWFQEIPSSSFYMKVKLTFKGEDKVTGRLGEIFAEFNPIHGYKMPPRRLQTCEGEQPFTAYFVGAQSRRLLPPNTVRLKDGGTEYFSRVSVQAR